ncbi:MAG TPA: hypothetical protein VLI72_00900 [Methylibium sp.]|nr:hypothetical protein [Methylibium sp.]
MPTSLRRLVPLLAAVGATAAAAQGGDIFKDADLALGERLMTEHRCQQCHASKFGGDGSAVYRPGERISTPGLLRGMVEQCNTELGLGMFPEEVTAVAAVLQRDHYRFRAAAPR